MIRVIAILLVHLSATCLIAQSPRTLHDQPQDQQLAVKKILDLGGDWEAPSKTVLIGFIGDKFTNETFELLQPLSDLRILYLAGIPADDTAFQHCKDLDSLEEIHIIHCKFNGSGLRYLAKCKRLKRICIEETPICDQCLAAISKFSSLESIDIQNFEVGSTATSNGVRKLAELKNLKRIWIDLTISENGLESEMKAILPDCELSFGKIPADAKKLKSKELHRSSVGSSSLHKQSSDGTP